MSLTDFLQSVDWPTTTLVLDAETYTSGKYALGTVPTYEYVADERFELLGWAQKMSQNRAEFHTELPKVNWNSVTVIMHNAKFDALILALRYGLYPPYILDTLDLARHIEPRHDNSLRALCDRYNLPAKGNTKQFFDKHLVDFDAQSWVELINYATNDAEQTYALAGILSPYLSNPKTELELATWTRNLFIRPILQLNFDKAAEVQIQMEQELADKLAGADVTGTQVRSEPQFRTLLETEGVPVPLKRGKKGLILALAKNDPEYKHFLTHENPQVRKLMEAKVAAKSFPLHIRRVQRIVSIAKAADGKLPIPLHYYGGHTGRWSGAEKVNIQNLPARV